MKTLAHTPASFRSVPCVGFDDKRSIRLPEPTVRVSSTPYVPNPEDLDREDDDKIVHLDTAALEALTFEVFLGDSLVLTRTVVSRAAGTIRRPPLHKFDYKLVDVSIASYKRTLINMVKKTLTGRSVDALASNARKSADRIERIANSVAEDRVKYARKHGPAAHCLSGRAFAEVFCADHVLVMKCCEAAIRSVRAP